MKNVMENVPHEVLEATCSRSPAGHGRESGQAHLELSDCGKKLFWPVWVWLLVSFRTEKGGKKGNGNRNWGDGALDMARQRADSSGDSGKHQ